MIDYCELPEDGNAFEQFCRELLVESGYDVHWTGVGPDGGKDLIINEKLEGPLSCYMRKWLVSCKHKAHGGKSLGRVEAGSIYEDCSSINATGFLLICSTHPSSSLVTRLDEIRTNHKIETIFWDSIKIEKQLLKPSNFHLIHTFFPESARNYEWKIYNTFSPSFWAANYKKHFLYLSCRQSNNYRNVKDIEVIDNMINAIEIPENDCIKIRAVYYDDKYSNHLAYIDYLIDNGTDDKNVPLHEVLESNLNAQFGRFTHGEMNLPSWDIKYYKTNWCSDNYNVNHKEYYEPYMREFEYGNQR